MKKNKKTKNNEQKIRPLTESELLEEEKRYQACKKPIQIAWAIYAFSATLYIVGGLAAQSAVNQIPQKMPIVESLNEYKYSEEYSDFITEAQKNTIDSLQKGEITVDEYEHIMSTLSSDEKFEEFLRSIENDKRVQKIISEYDENAKQLEILGKKYAGTSITALSSLLVASLILAKYRFREMDIEEARKKRESLDSESEQMQ